MIDWTAILTSFFGNLPATLFALGTLIGIMFNSRRGKRNEQSIKRIEEHTNGMSEALQASAGAAGEAKGRAQGIEAERVRAEDQAKP